MTHDDQTGRTRASYPPPTVNQLVLELLRSTLHHLLDRAICELRFSGRRSGRAIALPVLYADYGASLLIVVGDAPDNQWWRNSRTPHPAPRAGWRSVAAAGCATAAAGWWPRIRTGRSRRVEVVDNTDGMGSVFCAVVDTAAPPVAGGAARSCARRCLAN